jgi:hypothetical protein
MIARRVSASPLPAAPLMTNCSGDSGSISGQTPSRVKSAPNTLLWTGGPGANARRTALTLWMLGIAWVFRVINCQAGLWLGRHDSRKCEAPEYPNALILLFAFFDAKVPKMRLF